MIIKFMTFNIQHCLNYVKRVIDIDIMIDTIKKCNADIIGLNEVFGADDYNSSQAEEIAKKLGFYFYFGKAIDFKGRPYGNAIISKYPLKTVETIMIKDPIKNTDEYYETRSIIKAEFSQPNFTVLISHFGLAKSEQVNAVDTITKLIKNIKMPLIVMGDFNMEPFNPLMDSLFNLLIDTLKVNLLTFPSINPTRKIDYIFVSNNIEVISADIPNIIASDHLPHIATLNIKE